MLIFGGLVSGCGKGWQMDYGKPAAQFYAYDVARMTARNLLLAGGP